MEVTYYTDAEMIPNGFYYFEDDDPETEVASVKAIRPDEFFEVLTPMQIHRFIEWGSFHGWIEPVAIVGISILPDHGDRTLVLRDQDQATYEITREGEVYRPEVNHPPTYGTFAELFERKARA